MSNDVSRRARATEAMSPAKRLDAFRVLSNELYMAQGAVSQQARRLRADDQPALEYMADGRALITSLHDTRRVAGACFDLVAKRDRAHVSGALNAFDAEVPGLKEARDALQHTDEYAIGLGRSPGVKAQRYVRGGQASVVVGSIAIDVERAYGAAVMLVGDIVVGVELRRRGRGLRSWLDIGPRELVTDVALGG